MTSIRKKSQSTQTNDCKRWLRQAIADGEVDLLMIGKESVTVVTRSSRLYDYMLRVRRGDGIRHEGGRCTCVIAVRDALITARQIA